MKWKTLICSLLLVGCTNIYIFGTENQVIFKPDVLDKKKAAPEKAAKTHNK